MTNTDISADIHLLLNGCHQWPDYKGYRRISQQNSEIRLLRVELRYTSNLQKLCASILHTSLTNEHVQYEALSYCWGPPDHQQSFFIDGQEVFIRSSLYTFLFNLCNRPGGQLLPVWLDSICINQRDSDERNSQVALMGTIYSNASQVLVWLGESTLDANYLFLYLQASHDRRVQECAHRSWLEEKARDGIEDVAQRPYWKRLWIVQEIALAKRIFIWCGNRAIEWSDFMRGMISLCDLNEPDCGSLKVDEAVKFVEFMRKVRTSTGPHLDQTIIKRSLAICIEDFHIQRCEDPKDRVYGLVSLAADGVYLKIDYTKSMLEILRDVVLLDWAGHGRSVRIGKDSLDWLCETTKNMLSQLHICREVGGIAQWAGKLHDIPVSRTIDLYTHAYVYFDASNGRNNSVPHTNSIIIGKFSQHRTVFECLTGNSSSDYPWRIGVSLRYEDIGPYFYPHRPTDWPRDDDMIFTWPNARDLKLCRFLENLAFVFRLGDFARGKMRFIGVICDGRRRGYRGPSQEALIANIVAEDESFYMSVTDRSDTDVNHSCRIHITMNDMLLFIMSLADSDQRKAFLLTSHVRRYLREYRRRRWSAASSLQQSVSPKVDTNLLMNLDKNVPTSREWARYQLREVCDDCYYNFIGHYKQTSKAKESLFWWFDYTMIMSRSILYSNSLPQETHHISEGSANDEIEDEDSANYDDKRLVELIRLDHLVYIIGMMRIADRKASAKIRTRPDISVFEDFWMSVGLFFLDPLLSSEEKFFARITSRIESRSRSQELRQKSRELLNRYVRLRSVCKVWQHYQAIKATLAR